MKNNNVVVFGGAGFLGSHVADTLTNSGYDVTIFDRIKSPYINKNQKIHGLSWDLCGAVWCPGRYKTSK